MVLADEVTGTQAAEAEIGQAEAGKRMHRAERMAQVGSAADWTLKTHAGGAAVMDGAGGDPAADWTGKADARGRPEDGNRSAAGQGTGTDDTREHRRMTQETGEWKRMT